MIDNWRGRFLRLWFLYATYMKSIIGTGRLIIWLIVIVFRSDLAATFALQSILIVYHSQSNWIFDIVCML